MLHRSLVLAASGCALLLLSCTGAAAAIDRIDGPPPPVPPAVIVRDGEGRATVRAIRLAEGLTIDGTLSEAIYRGTPAISDFLQQEPHEGEPATEKTEAWIFFDDRNVYIAARCWDTHPERIVANEMKRDGPIPQNDNFAVALDTCYDRRNGFVFQVNPIGRMADGQITDERDDNRDWNGVWNSKGRDTLSSGFPYLQNRSLAVKLTRLFRF